MGNPIDNEDTQEEIMGKIEQEQIEEIRIKRLPDIEIGNSSKLREAQ